MLKVGALLGLSSFLALAACGPISGGSGGNCPQPWQTQGTSGSYQGSATYTLGSQPEATETMTCTGGFNADVSKPGSFSLSCTTLGRNILKLSGSVAEIGSTPIGKWPAEEPITVSLDDQGSTTCSGSVTGTVTVEITDRAGSAVSDAGAQTVTGDFHVKGILHVDVTQNQTFGDATKCSLRAEQTTIPFELVSTNACAAE